MSKAASVEFRAVIKRYGDVVAVDRVSFTVEAGTLVTLLGPSGCGKTTTLRLIAGLELASEGSILIGGEDVTRRSAADRDVSMVFQSYALFPHMSVLDNVSYGPSVSGAGREASRAMAREKLKLVGLDALEARMPSELSGGQQQRVAVARALVLEPKVLLFDEPLSNLDAKLRRRVRDEIRDLQQKLGLTVVYVTHDQQEALAVSDRVIVMSNAAIAQQGAPRELYGAPANRFVADFIGDANVVSATVTAVDAGRARVRIGELDMDLVSRGLAPGAAEVAIHPWAIRLSQTGESAASMTGRIEKAVYLGGHHEYSVACAAGSLFVIAGAEAAAWEVGDEVRVAFEQTGVALIPAA